MPARSRRTKNLGVSVIFLLSFVCPVAGQDLTTKVADYMNAQVNVNDFRGSILIAQGGKVLVSKAYDSASSTTAASSHGAKRYSLGPIAKQFTAAAILQLQAKGDLQLQDSVCKYIPECPTDWQPIKLFNLLLQTDGIPEITRSSDNRKTASPGGFSRVLMRIEDRSLKFRPGEKFKYGNSGYVVLSAVIERISGEPYPEYLREHIFMPLGMQDTGHAEGTHIGRDSNYRQNREPGGDQLYSTVKDLYRWDRELYGGRTISKQLTDEMFKPYVDGYGFGWAILKEFDRIVDTQVGGLQVLGSSMRRYPGAETCVIVLSSLKDIDAEKISRDLAAILFGRHYELPIQHHRIALDPKFYDSYVGRYELAQDSGIIVTREGGRLMIQGIEPGKVEILPESETRFFVKNLGSEINFVKGTNGDAAELILQQGGRDLSLVRIN